MIAINHLGQPPTPSSTLEAIGSYVAGLRDSVASAKKEAVNAYNTLKKVRANLSLPFMSAASGESGTDGNGWTPDLEQQAVDVTAMANLLVAAADDVLAGKRKLFWDDQLKNFSIEGFQSDMLRLQLDAAGVPVLVDASGNQQHITGQVGVAPVVIFGVGAALVLVQALILYLLINKALQTLQVIAEQKTQKTLAEAAKKHADLVASGKATAEDAAKLNKSMYDGATSLQKEQTSSAAAKKGFESDTLKTLGFIALGLGILYAIVKLVPTPAQRGMLAPARNPKGYPYEKSPTGRYILLRDGSEVMRGTEQDVWEYIHKNHSYSVEHALRYEGYHLIPDNSARRRANPRREEGDETAASELELYVDNDDRFSPHGHGQGRAISANLWKKWKKGTYDSTQAPKAWSYVVESAAKAYAKEFDSASNWSRMFNPATRDIVSRNLAKQWEDEARGGEFDRYPPTAA